MLAKWKTLLTNWINCYFNDETTEKAQSVTTESLLCIITHLRENFSLDESKTSLLESHTLEEFLSDKFTEFFFVNGTVSPSTEDEIYMVASLLLYFVCVSSKDVNLKNAMCQRLSAQDQETVLKFNRSLMEHDCISRRDVETAILEACGQELASAGDLQLNVLTTPPALRSLHGEVRRLQAALDAERFDRNFLQEELARSNCRIEKLAKEKEDYKLEITNLRAKVVDSQHEESAPADQASKPSTKSLMRQVDDLEQRMVDTRSLLDEITAERDTYKKKVEELKVERDKWLTCSQEEARRADKAQDLYESERKLADSLRELIGELQTHNRHNGIDTSQLECDDVDVTAHSFAQNASVCSEACANVIEVQLTEEKNKTAALSEQVQYLQCQITEMNEKFQLDMATVEAVIRQRDTEISDLKHRLNEEIHEKNRIRTEFSEESVKLNNKINELEQKLKINGENFYKAMDSRLAEIKSLQEEKQSLIQSLSDQTTKLEGIISSHETTISQITDELYTEKNQMQKMKEDYENRMMKLNEKVLNRNNELVELQNSVCEKGEKIETLQMELKREKTQTKNLIAKYNQDIEIANAEKAMLEAEYRQKVDVINEIQNQLQDHSVRSEHLSEDLNAMKKMNEALNEEINSLSDTREQLRNELMNRDCLLEQLQQNLKQLEYVLVEERKQFEAALYEKDIALNELKNSYDSEMTTKAGLQEEVQQLYDARTDLTDELNRLSADLEKSRQVIHDKDRMIDAMDMYLNDEKSINSTLRENCDELNLRINKLTNQLEDRQKELEDSQHILCSEINTLKCRIDEGNTAVKTLKEQIITLEQDRQELITFNSILETDKDTMSKCLEEARVREESLEQIVDSLKMESQDMQQKLVDSYENHNKHESERKTLTTRIAELEKNIKDFKSKSKGTIKSKNAEIENLQSSLAKSADEVSSAKHHIEQMSKELDLLSDSVLSNSATIAAKDNEIGNITMQNEALSKSLNETSNELKKVQDYLEHELEKRNALIKQKEIEIHDLQLELDQTKHKVNYQTDELQIKNVLCNELTQFKQTLEKTIEAERSNHEEIVKQYKENLHKLETTLNEANNKINILESEYNNTRMDLTKQLEEFKHTLQTENNKYSHVMDLKNELENQLIELENCLDTMKSEQNEIVSERDELIIKLNLLEETLTKEKETSLAKIKEYSINKAALTQQLLEQSLVTELLAEEKSRLISEKEILTQQLLEGRSTIDILLSEKEHFKSEKEDIEAQFVLEKGIRDELEKEKCMLVEQLSIQVSSNTNLNSEIANKTKQLKFLEHENTLCLQKLATVEDLQNKLKSELNALVNDNKTLKTHLSDEEEKINLLRDDKEILMNEKAAVLESMTEEKMLKDLIENEKNEQIAKLEDINEEVLKDLNSKTEEITQICEELQMLKQDYYEKQETIYKLASLLSSGLNKLTSTLKIENALNNVFKKFVDTDKSVNYQDVPLHEQCNIIVNLAETLVPELISKELALNEEKIAGDLLREDVKQKQTFILKLQQSNKELNESVNGMKSDIDKKTEEYHATLEERLNTIKQLQKQNQSLQMEINDVKIRLEVKVHALKEKLVDNENLTEKLKNTYECQIQNLNVMSNKLTDYLKDKAYELDELRKEKDKMQVRLDENQHAIKSLQDELKAEKQQQEKLISDFESERLVLKNMITVTESVMEDQKISYEKTISNYDKIKQELHDENAKLKDTIKLETFRFETIIREKEEAFQILYRDFSDARSLKEALERKVAKLDEDIDVKTKELKVSDEAYNKAVKQLKEFEKDITATVKCLDDKLTSKENEFSKLIREKQSVIQSLTQDNSALKANVAKLNMDLSKLRDEKSSIEKSRAKLEQTIEDNGLLLNQIKIENKSLNKEIEDDKKVISELDDLIKQLRLDNEELTANFELYKTEMKTELDQKLQEIANLHLEIDKLRNVAETVEALKQEAAEKDVIINAVNNVLAEEKVARKNHEQDLAHAVVLANQDVFRTKDNNSHASQETQSSSHHKHRSRKEHRDHQVDMSTSDLASSLDSNRTITDLEKIIHDKNRTITTLQSDITYLKSLMAESENKLLDVTKELEVSQDNCHQLSGQLKKIVHQKNEEIADLKKQVSKMSVTENRASQIIKVSAKYQAIILKRIAEIKQTTVLKELTNFGNSSVDNELRKSIADAVTMEDLENFLETTDKHLKRCSEKQVVLQKERDRLLEVNRIHESEIINMKKFLTELSVSFKTLTSLKEMYTLKLSRVVSIQRTVRREILNLDGKVSLSKMCNLERGYAAAMQDMAECVMNLERWMERCIGRTISPEKIKQAYTSELDRVSIASGSFQNASLEVQLEELENSFQKLLEEVLRAQKMGTEKDDQAATVMEVRAEYEDKLNRMKAKMKQLYQEQISIFRVKQKEEVAVLERELQETQDKLTESSRAYEDHIRGLTTELWNVGEKFLVKMDEADWLRRRQKHGSLMSLQNVPVQVESRASDVSSLRSLPGHASKSDRRGLHMSDEEGEVFDNRYLRELNETPRTNRSPQPKVRLSELKWRNSLCPPHLKSSYPAEMQFAHSINEEEIKCIGGTSSATSTARQQQRKEVGITAYKKPGPPTPSKQAGRLSATDSDLRDALRCDPEPSLMRKTTTPSRIRSLFFSSRHDAHDGTPRKRLGIFRNKKQ